MALTRVVQNAAWARVHSSRKRTRKASSKAGMNSRDGPEWRGEGRMEDQRQHRRDSQHEGQRYQLRGHVVGDIRMDRVHGLQQREGEGPLPDAVFEFVHDPGVGDIG